MHSSKAFFCCLFFLFAQLPISQIPSDEVKHDKFVIHSIPKCGTHFIQHVITLMLNKSCPHSPLSIDALRKTECQNQILRIFDGYSTASLNLLKKENYKIITMVRDPRDALISLLFYMRSYKGKGQRRDFYVVCPNFDDLSFDKQLEALIVGTKDMQSYLTFYTSLAGWALNPYSLMIRYEDLVGNEGGGSDALQAQAIQDIANYLNINLTNGLLNHILHNMYVKKGKNLVHEKNVFVRSSIGNWSTFMKKKHRKLFKKHAGNLLIQLGYEKNNDW